ncbi:MAG: hypothetical protein P1U40_14555 [Coxiellaceae bacterium]|nr:hypothetical protein [Coxiellaceae bacterium]
MKARYLIVVSLLSGLVVTAVQAEPGANIGDPGGLAPATNSISIKDAEQDRMIERNPHMENAAGKSELFLKKAAGKNAEEQGQTSNHASDKALNQQK